jgi:hypothetical protein
MEPNFNRYRAIGERFVTGFLQPEILLVLDVLSAAQRTKQVSSVNTVRAVAEQDSLLLTRNGKVTGE